MITPIYNPNFTPEQPMAESHIFDEQYYLELYADVKNAVMAGIFATGKEHYERFGMAEGRDANFLARDILRYNPQLIDHVDAYSDPLTLKGYVAPERGPEDKLNMVDVPDIFKPIQSIEYPEGNTIPFERYFENYFVENRPQTLRKFLPIHWTAYYVNCNQGTDKDAMAKLQDFINTLPKGEKLFTLVQHDNGIMNDISGLDILVYSMGNNKPGYYPIPLLSYPLCASPFQTPEKDLLYSFIGAETHPIRTQLEKELRNNPNSRVTLGNTTHERYLENLARSKYCLAPRGYGITSFRLYEGCALNCVPVYISDEFWEPFNIPFEDYGIKIRPDQIKNIPEILASTNIAKLQHKIKEYFNNYFTYSSCAEKIIQTLL